MGRLQIFFPFCWLPFYSNDSFFCCAEALYYTWIPFVKFGFCCQCFWCVSHEVLAHAYVLMVLSKFSSRVFMVLGLTFKSLIHLELIFVLSVKKGSSFSFLLMASQFSQHHLLNRESFSHGLFLSNLSKIRWFQRYGVICEDFVLFHWSIYLFW